MTPTTTTWLLLQIIAGNIAMLMLWWCIVRVRRRIERLERRFDALKRAHYEQTYV